MARSVEEGKVLRKAEIMNKDIVVKVIFEQALGVYGICDTSDNAGLLHELNTIEALRDNAYADATIGQLTIAYLEQKLAKLKANQ
jgi:hypothetical protein